MPAFSYTLRKTTENPQTGQPVSGLRLEPEDYRMLARIATAIEVFFGCSHFVSRSTKLQELEFAFLLLLSVAKIYKSISLNHLS
jgi:hypothetical protein